MDTLSRPADQPRKKIRKGTRSCWECKHRKVRCIFNSEGDTKCKECFIRGISCRSQDLPEPENPRESDRVGLNERLTRVESHLESISPRLAEILQRLETFGTDGRHSQLTVRLKNERESPPARQETAPVLELFKDESLGFQKSGTEIPKRTTYSTTSPDWQNLREELMALLPSPETIERISEGSAGWWIGRSILFQDSDTSLLPIPLEVLWESHPAVIGKVILWIALALQQLPLGYDASSLELPEPPKVLAEIIIATVTKRVCSDDSVVTCIDGIECLVVQATIFGNNGKLRSAWLSHRRAIDIAQLIGIHHGVTNQAATAAFRRRATFIWRYILTMDRQISLILGVNGSVTNMTIDSHQSDPTDLKEDPARNGTALWPMTRIAGAIIERNQTFTKVTPAMVEMTMSIDSEFEGLNMPAMISPSTHDAYGEDKDRERALITVSNQYWMAWYQLKASLFLPLLLESGAGSLYASHRRTCLDACRNQITCYHSLRVLCGKGYYNRIEDFQAFTAAMTIIINAVGPYGSQDSSPSDWELIYGVTTTFEFLSKDTPADDVANQCWRVLSTLIAVAMGKDFPQFAIPNEGDIKNEQDLPSRIKLDLPFFGAVFLERRTWGSIADRPRGQNEDQVSHSPSANTPSWMGTTLNSEGAPSLDADTMQPLTPSFDSTSGYWAVDTEFTFEAPFLADFEINWSSCDFGLS
ncbi:transcriptional regulator family: Fungal Specific TF [Penicillium brevicompactum]|uniref:Transcriptional regulator family: Fungal Specific TF n=1 Tax=Penicillium brevicompactum TaxID=5074 RepID=A0A9W9URY0_PENBR|nr:transcriptional regulator family: Fungal Specific TF [Penicillium brevicompactum]